MVEDDEVFSDIDSDGEEEGSGDDDNDPYNVEHIQNSAIIKKRGKDRRYEPIMTTFIKARVLNARTEQINAGSSVGIDPSVKGLTKSLEIAEEELRQGKCPLYVCKTSNDGKVTEYWHTNELQRTEPDDEGIFLPPIDRIKNMSLEELLGDCVAWPKIRNQRRDELPNIAVMPKKKTLSQVSSSS